MIRRPAAARVGMVLCALLCAWLAVGAGAAARAQSGGDAAIDVAGNRHIDAGMIRSYFHAAPDGKFDAGALNAALKRLYETGLFADVKIGRAGGRVLVTVVENPTIARIAFQGNNKVKDAELKKGLQSKPGGPLWRFLVQADAVRLAQIYRQHGYFQAKIVPQTVRRKGDRVDLVFQISEGDKLAVRDIRYVGNRSFPAYKLSGVVKTGQTNFLSFLLDNDIYNADKIAGDCDLLRQFYRAHGYADARVRDTASYDAARKGVALTFDIDEGPLYRFGKVAVASNLNGVAAADYDRYLRTQSGDAYDADAVHKTIDEMTMALAKNGQPFASVFAQTDREPPAGRPAAAGGVVNIVYIINPGKRLYVERIEIHGNTTTHDDVIRRQFDFGEGDPYNRALIDRAKRRLKALGYFKSVKIGTAPGSAPDRVIVDVDLTEQDTGNFSVSGGYSTSAGWLAQVNIGDTNLFGTGFSGKASVSYGEYQRGFELGLTDPYFLGQRLSGGVDVYANQALANVNQSFDSTVYGARLSLGMPLTERLGVAWNYSIYNQSVSLDPTQGISSLPIQQAAAAGPIWVSSIGPTVTYSTLDDPRNPTSGVRAQTSNEFAGLGGAARFAKTTEDVRYYHPVVGDVVGEVHAQSGYVTPWGGQSLPLLDGFFGGPQLLRGFAPNGFGPRDVTPGTAMDNLGGNLYWATSAELEAPAPGVPADAHLKVALFSDVGSLWATGSPASALASLSPSQQIANSSALRASAGVGLVWDSPFGPMQVDYAYPFATQPYDVTQRLSFTAGGF
jgi:outer membrane protein insertion porin family